MSDEVITPSLSHSLLLQAIEQISNVDHKIGVLQGQMNIVIGIQEKLDRIDSIAASVSRLVPLVDKHEARYNQTEGAMHFGRWIWTVIAGGAGAAILTLLQWLTGGHPGQHP